MKALVVGTLLAVLVALSWTPARAGYPDGVKYGDRFYVCITARSDSGTNPYSEPECSTLDYDFDLEQSEPFDWSMSCGTGTCSQWRRHYVVPPVGVGAYRLSCAFSGFVDDQGSGSGSFSHQKNTSGTHLSTTGTTMGASFTGLAVITMTHQSGVGHDFGDNTHDPFYDWLANGPNSSGYKGAYIETVLTTSGSQVVSGGGGNCIIDFWEGGYVAPTPTPTPTSTPVPATATPTMTPIPGLTPVVSTPFPGPTVWVATPEPFDFDLDEPVSATCYTLLPAIGLPDGSLFGYSWADVGWDYFELCVESYSMGLSWFGFDFGLWLGGLMLVAAFTVLYTLLKQG